MRIRSVPVALLVGAAMLGFSSTSARAQNLPQSITEPPAGAGTERAAPPGARPSIQPGIEASVGLGSGFADTYGLGFAGRVGYTFANGVYGGINGQYYGGHTVNDQSAHAEFIGGEVGYKFYPNARVEVRPYLFGGAGFITQVVAHPLTVVPTSGIAVQPGVTATYHFGDAFIGGDARYMAIPSPNTIAIMANAGLGF
jgi:hypothetical protein